MKKVILLLLTVVIAVFGYQLYLSPRGSSPSVSSSPNATLNADGMETGSAGVGGGSQGGGSASTPLTASEEPEDSHEIPPAIDAYKSSDEALAAIKKGSLDYSDEILEQFTEIGPDCTWCDSLYASLKELMLAAETPNDQKSCFAEILAVSGRLENIRSLVDSIKNAPNADHADLIAEALELTAGNEEVVRFLGSQLESDNETVREASVAAITNQGTRVSAELLYQNTVQKGDPDGYYSLGIGLGELVPEEDALPFLQGLVMKRDQFSHLGVKALLNGGSEGIKVLLDTLGTSSNPEFDKSMLKDAVEHVTFDDETKEVLEGYVANSSAGTGYDFAKQALEEFKTAENETKEEADTTDKGVEAATEE